MKKIVYAALITLVALNSANSFARGGGHSSSSHSGGFHSSASHFSSHESFSSSSSSKTISLSKPSSVSSKTISLSKPVSMSGVQKPLSSSASSQAKNKVRKSRPSYYTRSISRPFGYSHYGYHNHNVNNDHYQPLTNAEWEKSVRMTQFYVNKFSSVSQFSNKGKMNCVGEVMDCNVNRQNFNYSMAFVQGYTEAMKVKMGKNTNVPDLQSYQFHVFQTNYRKNKYREKRVVAKMSGNVNDKNDIIDGFFTGYASGLYQKKNHIITF